MTNEERVIELEEKFAHQEFALEQMKETLHEQGLLINDLESKLKRLTDRLNEVQNNTNPVGPGNEKPPHY